MERPRVLVVEDNPGVLKLMTDILAEGYQVIPAPDGATALRLIGSEPIDVVLADIRMPGIDGFDVLGAVQSRSPATRTVMMTAYSNVPDAVRAIKLGAFDYIAKPLEAEEIQLVVARAVERLRGREGLGGPEPQLDRPRVLVVDDDPDVRSVMIAILEGAYQVQTAPDGETALGMIGSTPIDLVLTDLRMPGLSGLDVLAAVQSRVPSTKVVLMTGYACVPDAVAAMKLGAFDYIQKPLDPSELAQVVSRALRHKREIDSRGGSETPAISGDDHGEADRHEGQEVSLEFRRALEETRERASREYLEKLMRFFHGNVTNAAKRAGMTRESLHRVLRKYGVRSGPYKDLPEGGAGVPPGPNFRS
jgi:DNA-binding NtrC family response regulator